MSEHLETIIANLENAYHHGGAGEAVWEAAQILRRLDDPTEEMWAALDATCAPTGGKSDGARWRRSKRQQEAFSAFDVMLRLAVEPTKPAPR